MISTTTDDIVNVSVLPGAILTDALANAGGGGGGLSPADRAKLDSIEAGATANSPDAALRARANHTGTQASSTIADLASATRSTTATQLVAGPNVSITPAGDTLVIAATGGGGGGAPSGPAGGVLSGTYPDPGFAVGMATQTELTSGLAGKVATVAGKGLSTEDYTTTEKAKLAGIASGATANATDAALRARSSHTGTQTAATVSDFAAAARTALTGKANSFAAKQTFKEVVETVFAVPDAAGAVLTPANGTIQTWTLGAARTPVATGFNAGTGMLLMITAGAFTVTWTGMPVTWCTADGLPPTLRTSGVTTVVLWKVGSTVYGK